MAKPTASDAALELYEALEPAFTQYDEENDWAALRFCMALVAGDVDFIHEIVTDRDTGEPGWSLVFDPDLCPAAALPYLAQFAGAAIRPDMTEEQIRDAIKAPEAFGRGTVEQIEAVAKRRLTGTKTVIVTERYTGLAWRLRVETITAETPEPATTQAEITSEAKPIGIKLFFDTRVPWTWGEVLIEKATYPSWTKVKESFATWEAFRTFEP